jgi:hypothetical protein
MGFFKGIKNARDVAASAREAAAEHGGMPSLREGFSDAAKVFDDRGEREILKTGDAMKAVVKGMMMPVQGDRFAMQVPLEVQPPHGNPYLVHYVFTASRLQAPLSMGMDVPVKVSPEDPQRIAVQWDALKAEVAAAGGALAITMKGLSDASDGRFGAGTQAELMEKMMQGEPVTLPTPGAISAQAAGTADPQSRLAKLEQLKNGGLIDDAEYHAKRQQIIDSI